MTTSSARSTAAESKAAPARSSLPARQPPSERGVAPSHAISLLCVDDHAVLVEGLKAQFAIDGAIQVVGRLATAARLVDEVERLSPQVVLLDVEMPGPDAFEMADRLKQSHPEVRVIVLSAHVRDAFISAAFAAGAWGYFSKADDLDEIVRGIHEVVRNKVGAFVLGPKVRERCRPVTARRGAGASHAPASADSDDEPRTLLASLTARESEILRLIGKGLSRSQIAAQLCRSVKTIDGHQDRMRKKLGISARADLIRLAIREGFAQA